MRGRDRHELLRPRPTFWLAARHNQCRTDFGGGAVCGTAVEGTAVPFFSRSRELAVRLKSIWPTPITVVAPASLGGGPGSLEIRALEPTMRAHRPSPSHAAPGGRLHAWAGPRRCCWPLSGLASRCVLDHVRSMLTMPTRGDGDRSAPRPAEHPTSRTAQDVLRRTARRTGQTRRPRPYPVRDHVRPLRTRAAGDRAPDVRTASSAWRESIGRQHRCQGALALIRRAGLCAARGRRPCRFRVP
jgi:hypothetical protein